MTGDLSSQIGHKPDVIVHDNTSSFDGDDDYMPDKYLSRSAHDNKCNSFGLRLIELCKSLCLRVVNGRLYHEFDVGTYTFYESVKHKWNAFRTGLLTKAGLLDNLTSSIDTNSSCK